MSDAALIQVPDSSTDHSLQASGEASQLAGAFFPGAQHFVIAGGQYNSNIHYPPPPEPSDFRKIRMGDVDLLNEIRVDHTGNLYRGQGSVPVRRIYKARIEEKQSDMTVFVHRGDRAEEEWKREIERCSRFRHPNLAQLYGTVNSSGFYATIFHDELVPFHAYIEKYRDSPLSTVYLYAYFAAELYNAHEEFRSLFALACTSEWDALIRANAMFRQPPLWIRRSTGRPCVKYHPTSSVDRNAINGVVLQDLDTPLSDLGRHPERTLISLLSLHNYHHICEKYLSKAVVTSASGAAIRAGAIMLYPGSEFEVEIAHADGWARPLWGWRSHVHEYGLVMESGWTRCRADSYTRWNADGQINLPDPWLSQAHHVFTQSPYTANYEEYAFVYEIVYSVRCAYSPQTTSEGYLFLCPMDDLLSENGAFIVPKCFAYWSLDPEGNGRLTPDQASQLGFPAVQLERKVQYLRWDEQVYAGLSQFHAGKGFNPTSQDVARDIGFALYQLSHLPNVESAHVEEVVPEETAQNDTHHEARHEQLVHQPPARLINHRRMVISATIGLILALLAASLLSLSSSEDHRERILVV